MDLDDDTMQRLKYALDELNGDTRSEEKILKAFKDEKLIVISESDYWDLYARANEG